VFIVMPIIAPICLAVLIALPFLAARNPSRGIASEVPQEPKAPPSPGTVPEAPRPAPSARPRIRLPRPQPEDAAARRNVNRSAGHGLAPGDNVRESSWPR
jgi:hypothetical protein